MAGPIGDPSLPKLRMDGADVRLRFLRNGSPIGDVETEWESGNVGAVYVEHDDKLMGDPLNQPDHRRRGWTWDGTFFVPKLTIIQTFEQIEQQRDARVSVDDLSVIMLFTERLGDFESLSLLNGVFGWKMAMGGAEARNKVSVNARGRGIAVGKA